MRRDQAVGNDGTLLWIGDRTDRHLRPSFETCESMAAQVAFRPSAHAAIDRPAASVDRVVLAHSQRLIDRTAAFTLETLRSRHSDASIVHLDGPLVVGHTRGASQLDQPPRIAWHQGPWFVSRWFEPQSRSDTVIQPAIDGSRPGIGRSMLVVARRLIDAEPLIDQSASAGWSTAWTSSPNLFGHRRLDLICWDESLTPPSSTEQWRRRIAAAAKATHAATQHVWWTGASRQESAEAAYQAGVDLVMVKPFTTSALDVLLRSRAAGDADKHASMQLNAA
ncbi:MAG: hypothetical protein AAGA03_19040 [Planctomycetota bacterium]